MQFLDNVQSAWIDINPLLTTDFSITPSAAYYSETNGNFTTYIFTASATLTVDKVAKYKRETTYAHYFVVGGGGGTGSRLSGGGGGGGVNMGTMVLQEGFNYSITVGAGGTSNPATGPTTDEISQPGNTGSYSAFGTHAADGGGAGNPFGTTGGSGGCGGGGGYSGNGRPAIAGMANGPFIRKYSNTTGYPGNVGAGKNGPTGVNIGNGATGGGGGAGESGGRAYGPYTPNRIYKSGDGGNGVKVPSIHTVPTIYDTRPDGQYFGGGGGGGHSNLWFIYPIQRVRGIWWGRKWRQMAWTNRDTNTGGAAGGV